MGIGVAAPTQALAVAGTIQSTSGGVMFPDGSTQASSTTPTVLSNDTAVSNTVPQAGNFLFAAPTSAYVAGPNQTALIWSHASCEVPSGDGLGVRPAYNVNSSGDQTIGLWHYHTNTGAATANIENAQFQMLSLTQGSSYVFETGLTNSDTSTSYSATCYVHTFVLIM